VATAEKHFDELKRAVSTKKVESVYIGETAAKTEAPLTSFLEFFTYCYEELQLKHKAEYHSRKA